jgi:ABC-type branched-subunit amino acid transport system permease subunit
MTAFWILMIMGGAGLLFGVVYPVGAILVYPLYRMFGGEMTFGEYVRCL